MMAPINDFQIKQYGRLILRNPENLTLHFTANKNNSVLLLIHK